MNKKINDQTSKRKMAISNIDIATRSILKKINKKKLRTTENS